MNSRDIAHRRMHNLRLIGPPLQSPVEVVGRLGAVQSQDYGPAKWSLAQRSRGVGDSDIDRAFNDGNILRTHVLRPTWHFVLPADIRWMLELTAPRVHKMSAYYYRQLGLDSSTFKKCNARFERELRGGNQLTRKELAASLQGSGVATKGPAAAYALMNAELNGLICSGALKGKQHTYTLLDERAPDARSLSPDDALAELTLRYFTSHGPATAEDFHWWSSLTLADIRKGLEMMTSRLRNEEIEGVDYWFGSPSPRRKPQSPTVLLLQGLDEYVVGYKESRHVLAPTNASGSFRMEQIPFNGVITLDGRVAGHWKRTLKRDTVLIEAALYSPLDSQGTQALHSAAERHGQFLGATAAVLESRPI